MIYILLLIIVILIYMFIRREQKIKKIYQQVNQILFDQKDIYTQQYQEGTLSLLESEIVKLTNQLYEQNHLLENERGLLKQYLEDISHQMKTPLTSLNLIQERLKNSEGIEKRKLIKDQQILLHRIEWLVATLLKMAQLDSHTVTMQKEMITSQDFMQQFMTPFDIQLELKNIYLHTNIDDFSLSIDIYWTLEALSNVLKNCIEHTQDSGNISIVMKHNPLYDEIIIQDDGEGIDTEDLYHLFERFYKGKNANHQSIGIGLALSRMIIEQQNGVITVENTYPGAKFTIHFYHEII